MFKNKADNIVIIGGRTMEIVAITPNVTDDNYDDGYIVKLEPTTVLPETAGFSLTFPVRLKWSLRRDKYKKGEFLGIIRKKGEKRFKSVQKEYEQNRKLAWRRECLESTLEEILRE